MDDRHVAPTCFNAFLCPFLRAWAVPFYLLYTGLKILMKVPEDKVLGLFPRGSWLRRLVWTRYSSPAMLFEVG